MYGPTDNECPIYDDSFSYGGNLSMSVYKINDFAVIPTSEDDGWFMSDTSLKIERLKGFLRSVRFGDDASLGMMFEGKNKR